MSRPHDAITALSRQAIRDGSLYPTHVGHPYYIVAPRYIRTSAGVRSLHLLAHWLNVTGPRAYLFFPPEWNDPSLGANGDLCTPELTEGIIASHFARGATPIVVCSETYSGTLPNAPFTVRYFGNYLGLLGGAKERDPTEIPYGYSKRIAETLGAPENVLTIPVVDTATFTSDPVVVRNGVCFYAQKYKKVHGGRVFGLPRDAVEITRDEPGEQSPQEIADLFRRSEAFYCFEDSALILEAGLCGCPSILMPNKYFQTPLGVLDFGWDGFAWGDSPNEVQRARETVHKVAGNYQVVLERFFSQLQAFVSKTQAAVADIPYPKRITLPKTARQESLLRAFRRRGGRWLERAIGPGLAWRITRPISIPLNWLESMLSPRHCCKREQVGGTLQSGESPSKPENSNAE